MLRYSFHTKSADTAEVHTAPMGSRIQVIIIVGDATIVLVRNNCKVPQILLKDIYLTLYVNVIGE